MMFEVFSRTFLQDPWGRQDVGEPMKFDTPLLREFFGVFGGKSFNGGLYRTIHSADIRFWHERILTAFPEYERRVLCFGYDWMGRAFALDGRRKEDGRPGVLMFDVGGGDVFEIPANLITFHDSLVIRSAEPALATNLYKEWRASGGVAPAYDRCIGLRVPLFLGGEEDVSNLEDCDLDVYWSIFGQVLQQVGPPEDEE